MKRKLSEERIIDKAITLTSINTISIVGVYHEDKTLGILVVVSPQRSNLILSSNIPHCKANILIFDGLYVETNGWNGGYNLTQLELVKNGGLWREVNINNI